MTKTIDPQKFSNDIFTEYSMPAFDDGMIPQYVLGESMNSVRKVIDQSALLINKLNVRKRRIWRVEKPSNNAVASSEFVVISSNFVNLDFLLEFMQGDRYTNYLEDRSSGSSNSQKRVTPEIIMESTITIPEYNSEQERVASLLASVSCLITLHQRLLFC